MRIRLTILGPLVIVGICCVVAISLPADGDCSSGINKNHLDTTPKAFVDNETIEIDDANGLQIKHGVLGQSAQAVGTSNITTSSTSWSDMTNMSITLTTKGGNVLLMFSANHKTLASNTEYSLRFTEDGTGRHTIIRKYTAYNDNHIERPVSMQFLCTGLAADSHTFKVQWKLAASGTAYQNGDSYPRVFTAIELPN